MTVSKTPSDKYFISINCCDVPHQEFETTGSVIGIDLGVKDFVITSEGDKYLNPKYFAKSQKKLARLQRRHSRKQKGSKNREKSRLLIARQHEKVTNQRNDYLQKLSTYLVKNHDLIAVEDLNVKGMMKNHNLAKSIADVSFSNFVNMLKYKCEWNRKILIQIDRFFPSSQTCSECGYKNPEVKDLSVREWICPACRSHHDRDVNAAKNILTEGLRLVSS